MSKEESGASAAPTVALVNGACEQSPPSGLRSTGGHTRGPWGIEQTRDMLWVGPLREDGLKVDEVVVGLNIDRELTVTAALRQHRNACLIAAAPDLLAACVAQENLWTFTGEDARPEIKRVKDLRRAAIAKATGAA